MTGIGVNQELYEVMDTITVTNHADIEFIVVTNTDWWNGLTDGQRSIISNAAAIAENLLEIRWQVSKQKHMKSLKVME